MQFRVLGPLEVAEDGVSLPIGRGRERAVLALLLVRRNEVIAVETLVDDLWPEAPPATATKVVQNAVSRLRQVLGGDRIERKGRGYLLRIEDGELDLDGFERFIREAHYAFDRADTDAGSATLREALALWRGAPYADLAHEAGLRAEILRLEERRLGTLEERFDADLRLGRHTAVVAELESLVEQHPLRERLRGALMLALYRCGRQADALDTYRHGRRMLVEELGLEPGPALRNLERAILAQDASLDLDDQAEQTAKRAAVDPATPREERKLVTVLFMDALGLAAQPDHSDPEDVHAQLQPYYAAVREEVERFGGTVDRYVGATIMAVFGVPRSHDDDAERAVRAALAIIDRLDLDTRAAVETGEALVDLARGDAGEAVLAGEVVTSAALLREDAPVAGVLVGERSRQAARTALDLQEAPDVVVPGASAPMRRWLVQGVRASARAIQAPFTGRAVELPLLEQAFVRTLRESTVQLVTITGEPGIGKTRLVAEFRTLLENRQPVLWRQGRCLPYGDGITYWALGEVVKAQAGILESDDPQQAAEKLEAAATAVLEDPTHRDWIVASLAPLVGAVSTSPVGADERAETSFTGWRRFLEAIAVHDPLVLVFEDLQWADPALLDFLDRLADSGSPVPMLVVCTARPELYDMRPGWGGGKRNSTAIALSPLSEEETGRLLAALLARAVLPGVVHDVLLERSGGNPLYAEEFARMLVDRGILERHGRRGVIAPGAEIPVPESIHAVIAARIDLLPPERKVLLQDAAVIGRVFWSSAVADMQMIDEATVDAALREVARTELIRPARVSSLSDEAEYSFWHALVRDVAYGQIPRAVRARKHEAAADWTERLAGDRVTDHAELLAHHYLRALELRRAVGDDPTAQLEERAVRFLALAGDHALQLDVSRAESYYRRALELLSSHDERRPRILAKIAEAAWLAGRLPEAESAYEEIIPAFQRLGDALGAGEALVGLVQSLRDRGETERSRRLLAQALAVLESEPPGRELALAYLHQARDAMLEIRPTECLEASEKAIAIFERLGLDHHIARVLQFRGIARAETGDLGGIDDLRESLRTSLELGLGYYTVNAYGNLADILLPVDGPAEALELLRAGVAFGDVRGIAFKARWTETELLRALADLGRWGEVLDVGERLISWDEEYGGSQIGVMARISCADVLARRGDVERAHAVVDEVLLQARTIGDAQVLAPALVVGALCSEQEGRLEEVHTHVEALAEVAARSPLQASLVLPDAARLANAAGFPDLAERFVVRARLARGARVEVALLTARAVVAESGRRLEEAAALYAQAAESWCSCGHVPEYGRAELGAGRCLVSLGRPSDARGALEAARSVFRGLGAAPLLREARELLERATVLVG
ncbi:MAG TPA: BTAD domain-containing putative transcriptional regulator [Gaiellaceae bacterium]|nr:BTAD domain-containing putative transcriptional regulator [Gaiellaceae bacterium]